MQVVSPGHTLLVDKKDTAWYERAKENKHMIVTSSRDFFFGFFFRRKYRVR